MQPESCRTESGKAGQQVAVKETAEFVKETIVVSPVMVTTESGARTASSLAY
jgi:hypothetical protein